MKKHKIIKIILIIMIAIFSVTFVIVKPYIFKLNLNISWKTEEKSKEEVLSYNFLKSKMYKDGYGVYTNYIDEPDQGDITKGHTVLSESQGLWMLYLINSGEKDSFDSNYNIVKNKMSLKNGLISWRYNESETTKASSTIDDLRIVKSLLYAYDRWGDFKYKYLAISISQDILKNVSKGGYIFDFNDGTTMSNLVQLCYLDFKTMELLEKSNSKWKKIYNNSLDIVKNGQPVKGVPLFKKSYLPKENKYSDEKDVELLYSLIVLKNLQSAGVDISKELDWLWNEFSKENKLYIKYDFNGNRTSDYESTSLYSICGEIFANANRQTEANAIKKRMLEFQVKNENSEIYGSFGNEQTKAVYSYDNLNALIFLAKKNADL
ncbi:glycosyl hydrolase family 8 [Clostridium sp. 'White wine YQ']|uniref:glycosyl hydrolase family 8 n=1 Tax=Clostridium sp. 'White wine YQ' TaxID=3027474 RepID=UPI0023661870|nr:glycosyl hydrolase family 8 [Clostridium sp. 'White wine YQ']MDD7794166.1 glycosyl hydrolase family 8 [Clostridium sp. 'White wine YQ']